MSPRKSRHAEGGASEGSGGKKKAVLVVSVRFGRNRGVLEIIWFSGDLLRGWVAGWVQHLGALACG